MVSQCNSFDSEYFGIWVIQPSIYFRSTSTPRADRRAKRDQRILVESVLSSSSIPDPDKSMEDVSHVDPGDKDKNQDKDKIISALRTRLRKQKALMNQMRNKERSAQFEKVVAKRYLLRSHSRAETNFILGKKNNPGHWDKEDIIKAFLLRAISIKAYRFLRNQKMMALPTITTLRRWIKNFECNPGVLTDSVEDI